MSLLNPCISAIGPKDAKIAVVGEAPGDQEELTGIPFIGTSGQELDRLLDEANIGRSRCYLTNVLWTRPPGNKIDALCVPKSETPPNYPLPPLRAGKYLHPDLVPEHARLMHELHSLRPNITIALGNTALWALLGTSGIQKLRGTVCESPIGKVIATFHPAYLYHGGWENRTIILADLIKAESESHYPEIRRPVRHVLIDPTLDEVQEWAVAAREAALLSVDSETFSGQITCLGFAWSASEAIVIPFFDRRKPSGSYWEIRQEIIVRKAVNSVLSSSVPKLFQNGMYDLQYLIREGYTVRNIAHDTMILQHALYPEMPKSLAFLGSIHTNDQAWKLLRPRGEEALKRED